MPISINYPPRISLANLPTPLQPLERLSKHLQGPKIWIKRDDLTGNATGGNKIRKLEFTLAAAQRAEADVIITAGGAQSNHCRATALLGAALGFKVHLFLRSDQPNLAEGGNLLLDQLAGAEISWLPAKSPSNQVFDAMLSLQQQYADQNMRAFVIPIGASDGIGLWGYINAAEELVADFANHHIEPTTIITATGSGGTQAGLTAGMQLLGSKTQVLGMAVCDNSAYFHNKVNADIRQWHQLFPQATNGNFDIEQLNIQVDDRFIGRGYAKASKEVFQCIQQLARMEAIVLDPVYSGKAFLGLIQLVKEQRWQPNEDIVFIHTGGIFGLMAQSEQCLEHL